MKTIIERLKNGIITENPTFVLMLGMCPTLAVTTSAINGIGMGLSTTVVLALSNLIISILRKAIPDRVRMPAFIVIVASFVTIVQFLMEGFVPSLYASLGIYIPLIVVNCIILGRAESYASKNPPIASLFDGIGMGLGFTASITVIGLVREFLGAGTLFDKQVLPLADPANGVPGFTPISIFVMAPGAFFILAILVAVMKELRLKMEKKGKPLAASASVFNDEDCTVCPFADSCTGKAAVMQIESGQKKETPVKTETVKAEAAGEDTEEKAKETVEEQTEALAKTPERSASQGNQKNAATKKTNTKKNNKGGKR